MCEICGRYDMTDPCTCDETAAETATRKSVQNRRGGVVHSNTTSAPVPDCNPWQNGSKFKIVSAPVNCKQCLRRGY